MESMKEIQERHAKYLIEEENEELCKNVSLIESFKNYCAELDIDL